MKPEKLEIRPYARLLTMLGDQLIKNERIALVELIKNSYDADADCVKVRFENFNEDMSAVIDSKIIIEDNGNGMTPADIRKSWMNPATPKKYAEKMAGKKKTPLKKRIIQGEKGIGRFAILKLGKDITITTRSRGSDFESVVHYDFKDFDDDFTKEKGEEKELFLDQIEIDYSEVSPPSIIPQSQGTVIEVRSLKGEWGRRIIENICQDISSLTDPVSRITGEKANDSFDISIICNGKPESIEDKNTEDLRGLIENKPVLKIQGEFNSKKNAFVYTEGEDKNNKIEIKLNDPKIMGLWIWRSLFRDERSENREFKCGSFKFHFYIFDFSRGISGKHELNPTQKNLLREHRIYLYRDGVRVYPYGDRDDDWLNIDVTRGTGRAGDFFSNDQLIGWIDISQQRNPDLRDKTNREGLIEKDSALRDFMNLIPIFLSYIKQYPYSRYQQKQKSRNIAGIVRQKIVAGHLADLKASLEKKGDNQGVREVTKIETEYQREKDFLIQRAETTEDLAGVGLSVEMTSHDVMLMMGRVDNIGKRIAKLSRSSGESEIQQQADMLVGILSQITEGMRDIQSLFKSSKRRKKSLKIEPVLDKIKQLYEGLLKKRNIDYEKFVSHGSPLVADTTDGVVMQVLINLFDNASYWLDSVERKDKKIIITVDGDQGELVFSDNGPGIDKEDQPYIFEPFYSGKGQAGRGLGLYIARQLLERHDYHIALASDEQKKLPGANFVVSFVKENG